MLLAPAALELSDQIQTLGAYAGFASVVGLAVLSLLYFGQARELRRLREWAGRAPERAAELQERVEAEAVAAAAGQKRVVVQPVRQAPGVQPATAAGAAASASPPAGTPASPATPGSTPAPAVPAVPAANPGAPGALTVPPAATPAGGAPATPAAPASASGTDQPTVVAPGGTPPATPPARPASPPPTGGGTGELTLPPAPPAVPAGGSTQDSGETAVPLRRVSAAAASPAGAARAGAAAPAAGGGKDKEKGDPAARGGTLAIIGGVLAVLLVGVLVATQVLGGDDSSPPPGNVITTAPADDAVVDDDADDTPRETTNTTTTPEVSPGSITVSVLNGTLTTGLAKGAADKVAAAGYKIGTITNASDQSRTTTTVQFAEGGRRAAEDVADRIGVPASAVSAIDEGTRVVAGEDATVVVTVGADQQP